MEGPEVLIPIIMFVGGFAMIFGIYYLKTKENMAMIEKNMNPKRKTNLPAPFGSLKLGLLLLGAGAGLLVAYFVDNGIATHHQPEPIYFALIAIGGGLGLVASYLLEKKEWDKIRAVEEAQHNTQQ